MEPRSPTKVLKVRDLGLRVREVRKKLDMDQAKTAGLSGVGVRFLSELERGKESVSMEKVLSVLRRLGLELWVAPKGFDPNRLEK
ncbi:MAG: helix-turn-helix transcriptional regulator [Oligoflexales bacterium]|nr:helix-turn-helix transcriptional regulator [Oligoflexales bacterium]